MNVYTFNQFALDLGDAGAVHARCARCGATTRFTADEPGDPPTVSLPAVLRWAQEHKSRPCRNGAQQS